MHWKKSFAKIGGNAISGYFCGLGTVSLGDANLETKLLQSLFGSAILVGIAIGKLLNDYGNQRAR